jgi:hypothetical protein
MTDPQDIHADPDPAFHTKGAKKCSMDTGQTLRQKDMH